jgi:hypothetical protein
VSSSGVNGAMTPKLLLIRALLLSGLQGAGLTTAQPASAPAGGPSATTGAGPKAPALAVYQTRKSSIPDTAYAHRELGLWCKQNGLQIEASIQFRLSAQVLAKETRTQRKWLEEWESRLRRWKSWLAMKGFKAEAETALATVTDPRAVPAIWKVFASGKSAVERRAVQLLGQIPSASASRGLALLAVSAEDPAARRAAVETLRWRDPMEFAGVLIGLLRDPVKYDLQAVRGPGLPGAVSIRGPVFNVEHVYAPPPPPPIAVFPDDTVRFDQHGMPILLRHLDTVGLPFVWVDNWGFSYHGTRGMLPRGMAILDPRVIPPHVPVAIQLGEIWRENWKSARVAEQQLTSEVAGIERTRAMQRAANEEVVRVLNQATGMHLAADRAVCLSWWYRRNGRTYEEPPERPRPTWTEFVPIEYMPREVTGLGYDPSTGYYVRAPAGR